MKTMQRREFLKATTLAAMLLTAFAVQAVMGVSAEGILAETKITGGLVVHVGCGDHPELTMALRANDSFVVQGLETDAEKVSKVRKAIQDAGMYGPVSVAEWDGKTLPYVDNLVNLVVSGAGCRVSKEEVTRVLAPGGVLIRLPETRTLNTETSFVKPRPETLDEWTHHLHSPDNNAVSRDREVGPPRGLQWVADPKWSRIGSLATSQDQFVTAHGRVFHTQDVAPGSSVFFPEEFWLIARDAFNGIELWRRPIADWRDFMFYKKGFPTVIHRRTVALGDDLFFTPGLGSPVHLLDAASGETRHVFEETAGAEELLVNESLILVTAADGDVYYSHALHALKEPQPRTIVAVDRQSRKTLWKKNGPVTAMSLTMTPDAVYYHDGQRVRALKAATGEEIWASEDILPLPRKIPSWYGPTVVAAENRVLVTVGPDNLGDLWETTGIDDLHALDAGNGKTVWKARHYPSGYKSPKDVFVIDGRVWFGDHAVGMVWKDRPEAGPPTTWKAFAHDLATGEKVREIEPDVQFDNQHNRCHRGKATVKYMMTAVRGIDFLDLEKGTWIKNNWVRAQCNIGFTPANGLIYFPPHACQCFQEMLIKGLNALTARSALDAGMDAAEARWVKGPAFSDADASALRPPASGDWPIYRGDPRRSGCNPSRIGRDLKVSWQSARDGDITAPVIADGRVYVGLKDRHAIQALDAASGKPLWRCDLDGGIDTPPTYANGHLYAGSRGGSVYCLRADTGAWVWRYRAAPNPLQTVAHGGLESVWPLSGTVLVVNDTVYALAGRSIHLDGGLRLIRLNAKTGESLGETVLEGADPKTGQPLDGKTVVGNPDLLLSDGQHLALKSRIFTLDGTPVGVPSESFPRILAADEFLDDFFFNRMQWTFTAKAQGRNTVRPFGRILAADDESVFGFGTKASHLYNSLTHDYRIFRSGHTPAAAPSAGKRRSKPEFETDWEMASPILAFALARADDALVVAGPENPLEEGKATPSNVPLERRLNEREKAQRALENLRGQHGSTLLILDPANGNIEQRIELPHLPVWDGMAIAQGHVFLSLQNGQIIRLSAQ